MFIYKIFFKPDNLEFCRKENVLGYVISGDEKFVYIITKREVRKHYVSWVRDSEEIAMVEFVFSGLHNIPDLCDVWDWFGPEPEDSVCKFSDDKPLRLVG